MRKLIVLLTLFLFSGLVSGSCQTYCDYWANITIEETIGNVNLTLADAVDTSGAGSIGDIRYDMEGSPYLWYNLSNVG